MATAKLNEELVRLPRGWEWEKDVLRRDCIPTGRRIGDLRYGAKYAHRGLPVNLKLQRNDKREYYLELSYFNIFIGEWVIVGENPLNENGEVDHILTENVLNPIFDLLIGKGLRLAW